MWEFMSSIFDTEFIDSITKLLVALLLAGFIGFEREMSRHSAGFRTHILVGVSACLMMILSVNGFDHFIDAHENIRFDPARIPSYVISGIGFLGAGTIIVHGGTVHGLTTAASIWSVAGLGLIVGNGMYKEAIVATLIILLSLVVLNKFSKAINRSNNNVMCEILISKDQSVLDFIEKIASQKVHIRKYSISNESGDLQRIHIHIDGINKKRFAELFRLLSDSNEVKKIEIDYTD